MCKLLRDYQLKAVNELKNGSILCGGVGSGKSRTSIAYYCKVNGGNVEGRHVTGMKKPCDLYIITTARKRDTLEWEAELPIFLLGKVEGETYYKNKIIVDSWNNIQKYIGVENAFFIFDEQRVIGSGAWTKAFIKITKHNKWILLSATPGDCWMDYVPVFIANGFFKNRSEFIRNHVVYSRFSKFPKVEKYIGTKKLERLRNDILVDMDFRRKTISHNIPVICSYDKNLYDSTMKNRWNPYLNQPIENVANLCYILRKIVNSDPSRLTRLSDIFDKHHKLIIFYNFTYELEMLREFASFLKGMDGFECAEWNGKKHEPIPNSDSWIYLVQYTAGAEGWNCITTDTIVFFSQNYSYKIMEQSSGRINRMNTPFKELYYYHMRSCSKIDLAIQKAIRTKKTFNERSYISKF